MQHIANKAAFYASLRQRGSGVFGASLSQPQVNGIEGILSAFAEVGDGKMDTLAYALATAYHETQAQMVPIKETVMSHHKDKNPSDREVIRRLDRWARKEGRTTDIYWRRDPETGRAYFGRGHVQLTWKDNYRASSADAGVDLLGHPEVMLDPVVSARILILGLLDGRWNKRGHGLRHYLDRKDVLEARRTVNLMDKAAVVAVYYRAFLTALQAGGWVDAPPPKAHPIPTDNTPTPPRTIWGAIQDIINALFGHKN